MKGSIEALVLLLIFPSCKSQCGKLLVCLLVGRSFCHGSNSHDTGSECPIRGAFPAGRGAERVQLGCSQADFAAIADVTKTRRPCSVTATESATQPTNVPGRERGRRAIRLDS